MRHRFIKDDLIKLHIIVRHPLWSLLNDWIESLGIPKEILEESECEEDLYRPNDKGHYFGRVDVA